MANLRDLHCFHVQPGTPPLTADEIGELMHEVGEWEIVEADSQKRLTRKFKFKNFQEALAFTNRVGELAEKEDHHPAILTEWGKVTVTWWTHTVQGLHKNDFIMAARTDAIER